MKTTFRARRAAVALAAAAATALVPAAAASASDHGPRGHQGRGDGLPASGRPGHGNGHGRLIDVQLLAFNDFHGNLEPPAGSSGAVQVAGTHVDDKGKVVPNTVPAGGAAYLAGNLAAARAGHRDSLTVAAGDLVGASPLLSGAFHDEPTVQAMNLLGLDVTSVGNHEFDEGSAELLRLANGGCRTNPDGSTASDSCPDGSFEGADYPMLAANVVSTKTGKPILPPYVVKTTKSGARIGFIGMTLKGTPDIVTAAGVAGLTFLDEVQTADKYADELTRQGVNAIVVLLHQGGIPASGVYNYDCNAGGGLGLTGPIVDIARTMTPKVDLLVTGHTHTSYVCDIPDPAGKDRMVTSASSFGRLFTDIDLKYDRATRDVVRTAVQAQNMIVARDPQREDADVAALVSHYQKLLEPVANRVVGYLAGTLPGRGCGTSYSCPGTGESPAGDLIADAQLWALQNDPQNPEGADFAIMNPGGIRGDFVCDPAPCGLTYGQAFAVQPFTNFMNVVELTGAQVKTMFQQQWTNQNPGEQRILQVSGNVAESYDPSSSQADGKLVSLTIDGAPVDDAKTYRVAMNEFLGGGGDGFTVIKEGVKAYTGSSDLDALTGYLTATTSPTDPYPVPASDRITVTS